MGGHCIGSVDVSLHTSELGAERGDFGRGKPGREEDVESQGGVTAGWGGRRRIKGNYWRM